MLRKTKSGAEKPKRTRTELPINYFMENEFPGLIQMFDVAAHLAGSVYVDTTAVKLPEALYRSTYVSNTRLLSEEFLLNYKRSSLDLGVMMGTGAYNQFRIRAALAGRHLSEEQQLEDTDAIVRLPPYQNVNTPLGIAIRERRSIREMSGKPMTLQTLSTLLFYANGVTGELQVVSEEKDSGWARTSLGEPPKMRTRAAPGGGGLYPVYLHLVIQNVGGIPDGVYIYLPHSHSLRRTSEWSNDVRGQHDILAKGWGPNMDPAKTNVAIHYVYALFENSRKYGDLGLHFALIEAGEIAENIHLVSTAMKLASSDVGGWDKANTERFLGLDGLSKHLIHLTVVGMR